MNAISTVQIGSWISYQDIANPRRFGVVYRINEPDPNRFVFAGAGLEPTGPRYDVVWESGSKGDTSDGELDGLGGWEHHPERELADQEAINALLAKADQLVRKRVQDQEDAEKQRAAMIERGKAICDEKMPAGTKAAIVALFRTDKSDTMTDYFGHSDGAPHIIAWSKSTRENFREMRKAVDLCDMEEIKHLGTGKDCYTIYKNAGPDDHRTRAGTLDDPLTGETHFTTKEEAQAVLDDAEMSDAEQIPPFVPEVPYGGTIERHSIEYREKYTGGSGYYLAGGIGFVHGWVVKKLSFAYGKERIYQEAGREGGYRVPETTTKRQTPKSPQDRTTNTVDGATISQHTHSKKGFEMWIVTLDIKVDKGRFMELLAQARETGGWYSRAWHGTPGGFAFKEEQAAIEFSAQIGGE